jgi:hypothetical protein
MRPLVNYARWQGARLRLLGRDESAVWGQLVFTAGEGKGEYSEERTQSFRFDLNSWRLELGDEGQVLQLDDMGVVVKKRLGD